MTSAPERLSAEGLALVTAEANELFLSVASCWEIAIKCSLGKLRLPADVADYLSTRLIETRATALPIQLSHAARVAALPHHHKDPFDRMLVAQAQIERLPILTADRQLAAYDVELLSP